MDIRTGARVVVLEQARPRLAFAALADDASVVITFPSGQVGAAAVLALGNCGAAAGCAVAALAALDGDPDVHTRRKAAEAQARIAAAARAAR